MNKSNVKYLIVIVLILIAGIAIRVAGWPDAISQINCDEAMTAINAKAIAEDGVDIYGTSYPIYLEAWQTTQQSVMLMYIMAIFIKIFGFSIFAIRLPMLLISIISLIIMFDFTRRIFNKKTALIVLIFLSITPWHIMQSRYSIDCNIFPHFMLFSTYFLYRGIINKKIYLYLSMILYALTMYTYGVSLYFVPLFLIITAIYLIRKKKINIKDLIICILLFFLISFPIFLMAFINLFKLSNISIGKITIQYFPLSERMNDIIFFSDNILQKGIENLIALIHTIDGRWDFPWNTIPQFGPIYHISILFFIIGLVVCNKKNNDNEQIITEQIGIKIILIWLIVSIILAIIINDVNINRINIIWYPIIIITGLGINYLTDKIKYKKTAISIISIIYLILTISFTYTYFNIWTNTIDNAGFWSNGLIDAIRYADNLETDKIHIVQNEHLDSIKRTETFIKYALNLDYKYYTFNETTNKNNKQLLSFAERYNIVEEINQTEKIIIIRKIDINSLKENVDINQYIATNYGQYIVLELKKEGNTMHFCIY